ncbi:hypothetical protein FOA52_002994 [Chlamydomonas sp. UWO 241]|nr:hypothetical protein FOA52_002994 [Chlamydomonas sp. UWO 241]
MRCGRRRDGNLGCTAGKCAVSAGEPNCSWPGHCVGAPCRTDNSDCADGLDCSAGTCAVRSLASLDVPCNTSNDCVDDLACTSGTCAAVVDTACNTSEDCVNDFVCTSGKCVAPSTPAGKGGGGTGAAPVVGAIVGAVAGVAVLLALLLLFWRRRNSRQDQDLLFAPGEPRDGGNGDAEARGSVWGSFAPPVQAWGSAAPVDYASEIELDVDFAKEVEPFLGRLIGVGASARVYQGTWRGAPVAVKIMTLDKEQQWKGDLGGVETYYERFVEPEQIEALHLELATLQLEPLPKKFEGLYKVCSSRREEVDGKKIKIIITPPAAAAGSSERNWPVWGHIFTKYCTRLGLIKGEMVVFIRRNSETVIITDGDEFEEISLEMLEEILEGEEEE